MDEIKVRGHEERGRRVREREWTENEEGQRGAGGEKRGHGGGHDTLCLHGQLIA